MKIIISHDVDHLYATDHLFKDLILEKLWVRSFLHLCSGKISLRTFFYRLTLLFHNRMHRIEEVMTCNRIMRPAYRAVIHNTPYIPVENR